MLLGICGVAMWDNCVVISGDVALGNNEAMAFMLDETERQKERKGFAIGGCGVNENTLDEMVNAVIGCDDLGLSERCGEGGRVDDDDGEG